MKRKPSGCLGLPGIRGLANEGDDFDNLRLQKRYLSEVRERQLLAPRISCCCRQLTGWLGSQAMANDMKRLSMALTTQAEPLSPASSSLRSDVEDPGACSSGQVTPMECSTPVNGSPLKGSSNDDSLAGVLSCAPA